VAWEVSSTLMVWNPQWHVCYSVLGIFTFQHMQICSAYELRPSQMRDNIFRYIILRLILVLFITQEIFAIKLPGEVILGEGKPENQNHAIVFTRGEALQTIDMNQVDIISILFHRIYCFLLFQSYLNWYWIDRFCTFLFFVLGALLGGNTKDAKPSRRIWFEESWASFPYHSWSSWACLHGQVWLWFLQYEVKRNAWQLFLNAFCTTVTFKAIQQKLQCHWVDSSF
jgi:hypothetical protein